MANACRKKDQSHQLSGKHNIKPKADATWLPPEWLELKSQVRPSAREDAKPLTPRRWVSECGWPRRRHTDTCLVIPCHPGPSPSGGYEPQRCSWTVTKRCSDEKVRRSCIHHRNKLTSTQKFMKRGKEKHSRLSHSDGNGPIHTLHNNKRRNWHQRHKLWLCLCDIQNLAKLVYDVQDQS